MKRTEWCNISNPARMRKKRNSVEFCYLGKVYFVLEKRNSYNWSRSLTYFGSDSFHPTV